MFWHSTPIKQPIIALKDESIAVFDVHTWANEGRKSDFETKLNRRDRQSICGLHFSGHSFLLFFQKLLKQTDFSAEFELNPEGSSGSTTQMWHMCENDFWNVVCFHSNAGRFISLHLWARVWIQHAVLKHSVRKNQMGKVRFPTFLSSNEGDKRSHNLWRKCSKNRCLISWIPRWSWLMLANPAKVT